MIRFYPNKIEIIFSFSVEEEVEMEDEEELDRQFVEDFDESDEEGDMEDLEDLPETSESSEDEEETRMANLCLMSSSPEGDTNDKGGWDISDGDLSHLKASFIFPHFANFDLS